MSLESLASWQWGSLPLVCGSRLIVSCLHFIHHSPTTCQANQARYHSVLILAAERPHRLTLTHHVSFFTKAHGIIRFSTSIIPQSKMASASVGQPLGPPTLNTSKSVDSIIPQTNNLILCEKTTTTEHDDTMESFDTQNFPTMGLMENFSPTYLSTGNPCLDFFYHVVSDTLSNDLIQRLDLAWAYDPLTALKLICNLRGMRGTGKSDKEGFYISSLWLHKSHPKTLALNLKASANFGCFKDFPEILYRLLYGPEVRKLAKQARCEKKRAKRNIHVDFYEEEEVQEEGILEKVEKISKEEARTLRKER